MMHTTLDNGSRPEPPNQFQPALADEETALVVPLSQADLSVPFAQPGLIENPAVNASVTPQPDHASSIDKPEISQNADQATASLTVPLKAKLVLVFGGLAGLFILSFSLSGWLFAAQSASGRTVADQTLLLNRVSQLEKAFAGEQAALGRLLLGNNRSPNDFEFKVNEITAENNLYLLDREVRADLKPVIRDLTERHRNLSGNYYEQITKDLISGSPETALNRWQESAALNEDLTARLAMLEQSETARAVEAKRTLEENQQTGWWELGLIAGCSAIMLGLIIWWANRFVIGPVGRLNVKLGQLLYGQTARITNRLNGLEFELDHQSQRIASARHDLKLPLSTIRNIAELSLLDEPAVTDQVRESLQEIIETTDASAAQINALLARGDERMELGWVELAGLVQRVVDLVDLRDFKLNIRVELAEACLDSQLMEHVLLNLLSNARKFSAGGIGIGARLVTPDRPTEPEPLQEVELWVWNDGPVIGPHEREAIFRPGGQTSVGKQAGGHGIGLAIVKAIAERHGGRVTLESHLKTGTTFRIFLPYIAPVGTETGANGSDSSQNGGRVTGVMTGNIDWPD